MPRHWYLAPRVHWTVLGILAAIAVVEGVIAIAVRDNDFLCHRNIGEAYLAGIVGRDHYLPARGLMNMSLALAPYRVTRFICYVISLVLLIVCWRIWARLGDRSDGTGEAIPRAAGLCAVFLVLPYLLRDLDECGLQIILLFLLSLGIWALQRGKAIQAGFWLATAVAYKVVPLLCLPFLLWQKQWRAAAAMIVFMLLWCAAPALHLGWDANRRAHEQWYAEIARIKAAKQAYPSLLDREPPVNYNLSIHAALARVLETYPPEHPLHLQHPGFIQFGNLSQHTAYHTVQGILAMLGLGFLWLTRSAWNRTQTRTNFVCDWAVICCLCALLSPSCWKQHLILVLPCVYLVFLNLLTAQTPDRWRWALIAWIGMVVYLGRQFLTGDLNQLVLSYKIDTMAIVTLVVWTMLLRHEDLATGAVHTTAPAERDDRRAA